MPGLELFRYEDAEGTCNVSSVSVTEVGADQADELMLVSVVMHVRDRLLDLPQGSLTCERVCVHRNLCLAIASAQVTFLAGVDAVGERVVCSIVALLLHYCYLAVFTWMLVEGLHLYSQVVRVFGTEHLRVRYYVCFGWGIPLILVAISAATNWQGYGTPTSCWLSTQRKTIWAFVGPALAIIMGFFIFLFHCAFNTEVRQAFKRLQERRSLQRGDLSSSSGYSSSASMSPTPQTQKMSALDARLRVGVGAGVGVHIVTTNHRNNLFVTWPQCQTSLDIILLRQETYGAQAQR
ncbi:hypothetical protein C0Q70_09946 [Pomacea canaliculata]|uniref:G-protein coupled receptors family 2 profile 2 domain-containing protein n=1 Tax=Pomacea canaliculata TaxID=400727 RepID=A0A2T7PB75_POMCA|nr:hypothetical protein C0Q70_09946 [Pomacea canaliculata]